MSKAALREQRRTQRIARRNRQRTIIGIIALLVVVVIGYLVYRDYQVKNQASPTAETTPLAQIDTSKPTPSTNAVTSASGLIYEDLRVGDGATAKVGDTVTVNYTGWLSDGTQFDSSTFDFTIGAGNVIAGWDEGVTGMLVNGIRLLVIPPSLGYGSAANGQIPANSTLTFEVQLVAIK